MPRTLESRDAHWNWPGPSSEALSHDRSDKAEQWPTPSVLFFQSGIVMGAALGTCALVDLFLMILGIPDVY
jgi:hypothetical protein